MALCLPAWEVDAGPAGHGVQILLFQQAEVMLRRESCSPGRCFVAAQGSRGWLKDSSLLSSLSHPPSCRVKSNFEANRQVTGGFVCSKNLVLDDAFADLGKRARCPCPSPCPAAQPLAESRALRGYFRGSWRCFKALRAKSVLSLHQPRNKKLLC